MQKFGLIIIFVLIIGSIFYLEAKKPKFEDVDPSEQVVSTVVEDANKAQKYDKAIEISTPDGFINTDSVKIADLIGKKVIMVDFWTYSCINCQRTTPYLNSWYERYQKDGLEIIGVHTPEFEFEKVYDNVANAVSDFGIKFPVVLDNDYSTWRSYKNRFWPRKYLIDIDGYIVYDHIGEGAYKETEAVIRKLLKERADKLGETIDLEAFAETPEATAKSAKPNTPEIYLGAARNQKYLDTEASNEPKANKFALAGNWQIEDQYATNKDSLASILLNFTAKNVFMVANANTKTRVVVTVDGKPLTKEAAGKDIVFEGKDSVFYADSERLYKLFSAPEQVSGKVLKLTPQQAGFEAYTFTFG